MPCLFPAETVARLSPTGHPADAFVGYEAWPSSFCNYDLARPVNDSSPNKKSRSSALSGKNMLHREANHSLRGTSIRSLLDRTIRTDCHSARWAATDIWLASSSVSPAGTNSGLGLARGVRMKVAPIVIPIPQANSVPKCRTLISNTEIIKLVAS